MTVQLSPFPAEPEPVSHSLGEVARFALVTSEPMTRVAFTCRQQSSRTVNRSDVY